MAVQIVFSDDTKIRVKYGGGAADLAKEFHSRSSSSWAGAFLHMDLTKGGDVWVNPDAVAYLEQWPED